MKIIFMGTPDFAVPCLDMLVKEGHEVCLVVTQPDKPKGRGKKMLFPPVKEKAIEYGIEVFQPVKVKEEEAVEKLRSYNADIIVVVAFGQILPESILNMPKYGCVNVHGSLLPKYRGAAPIQWSVINGDTKTGVTTMYMEKGLDTGDMLLKAEFDISDEDTYGTVHDKMCVMGADVLKETLVKIENGTIVREKQDDALSNYAPMISKETGHIDWNKTSFEIINLIRGLDPVPAAWTVYNGEVLKIWKAVKFECDNSTAKCGEIAYITKKGFVVKTGDSFVLVTEIQARGGKRMATDAYMRGHAVEKGIVLE